MARLDILLGREEPVVPVIGKYNHGKSRLLNASLPRPTRPRWSRVPFAAAMTAMDGNDSEKSATIASATGGSDGIGASSAKPRAT